MIRPSLTTTRQEAHATEVVVYSVQHPWHGLMSRVERTVRKCSMVVVQLSAIWAHPAVPAGHSGRLRCLIFGGVVRSVLVSERWPNLWILDVSGTVGMSNRPKFANEFGKRIRT